VRTGKIEREHSTQEGFFAFLVPGRSGMKQTKAAFGGLRPLSFCVRWQTRSGVPTTRSVSAAIRMRDYRSRTHWEGRSPFTSPRRNSSNRCTAGFRVPTVTHGLRTTLMRPAGRKRNRAWSARDAMRKLRESTAGPACESDRKGNGESGPLLRLHGKHAIYGEKNAKSTVILLT